MEIHPYKNRKINSKNRVRVYRNLHKDGYVYSIRQHGLIVGHTSELNLKNCRFIVNQFGRNKVIKEKRKNVHAYIEGLISNKVNNNCVLSLVSYNPYKNNQFVCVESGNSVLEADFVLIKNDKIAFCICH